MVTRSMGETGTLIETSIILFHIAGLHWFIPLLFYDCGQFVFST
jgi:hypothetical protein